ncbi:MAG: hypothetical protein E7527_03115 [Ruminococcaceae bacterium]|nr:hypothetical protein [Oscillospiraceae bacterium]
MKTRISKGAFWTWLIVGLCILCFIVVPAILGPADPHAGHDHANPSADPHGSADPHAGHNHADKAHNKDAADAYTVKKRSNGTYTYSVVSRAGHTYTAPEIYMTKPTLTEISKDVIAVSGQRGKSNNLSGWAIYYNVVGEGRTTHVYEYVLAMTDTKVAYLEGQKGKFCVVVCDPFNETHATRVALPELEKTITSQSSNPKMTYKELQDGTLQVTYTVNGAKKTVSVPLK